MGATSEYLDLAIAMAVVFFLASLIVSGLNEAIQWATRVRAKFLWAYLHDLTDKTSSKALPKGWKGVADLWGKDKRPKVEPPVPAEGGASAKVLSRLVAALNPIDAPQLTGGNRKTAISYVPAASLAQAFMEVFADIGRGPLDAQVAGLVSSLLLQPPIVPSIDELSALLTHDPTSRTAITSAFTAFTATLNGAPTDAQAAAAGATLGSALRSVPGAEATQSPDGDLPGAGEALAKAIRSAKTTPSAESSKRALAEGTKLSTAIIRTFPAAFGSRQRIETAIADLDGSPIAPTARRLWEAAEGNIDAFRAGLEKWLDSEMTRLGGYYKRSIRIVLALLALLVAFAINIDAIQLTADLWRNPKGRASLVLRADELVETAPAPSSGPPLVGSSPATTTTKPPTSSLRRVQLECEKAHPTADDAIKSSEDAAKAYGKVRTCVSDAVDQLSSLDLIDRRFASQGWRNDWRLRLRTAKWWLHLLGVLTTAAALVLGAPFWFDLIKRLTGIRNGKVGQT